MDYPKKNDEQKLARNKSIYFFFYTTRKFKLLRRERKLVKYFFTYPGIPDNVTLLRSGDISQRTWRSVENSRENQKKATRKISEWMTRRRRKETTSKLTGKCQVCRGMRKHDRQRLLPTPDTHTHTYKVKADSAICHARWPSG